jgi:hypothetical protein
MSAWIDRLALVTACLAVTATLSMALATDETPAAAKAQIQVATTPPGAIISCDGALRDAAPLTLTDLTPGPHLIVATKQGYRDARQTAIAKAGERVSVELTLEPILGLLLIHSTPPDADVQIDGAFKGKTPLLVTDLPLGRHRISAARDGYSPREVETLVRDRIPQKVEIPLVSTAARLVVDSTPKGAQVLINGVQRGETPLTLETVGAGEHTLELTAKGYETLRLPIRLEAGRTESLSPILKAIPAELTVVSIPSGARIYVNNQFRGESPISIKDLEPGTHRIRAELKGYAAPNPRDVTLEQAKKVVEEFRMVSNSGDFEITTTPPGVKVTVDDKDIGVTAAKDDAMDVVSKPLQVPLLAPGTHRVVLSKSGYEGKQFDIEITAGQTTIGHHALIVQFTPNHEIRTATGIYRGVLKEPDAQGNIRLEISPGVIKSFRAGDVRPLK